MVVAGCTSSSTESGSSTVPTTSDPRGGIPVGYPTDVDTLSPLVITALPPAPIPVTGTDDKVHVVYELEVLNYSPRAATLTRLETLSGGPDGEVVADVEGEDLAARTILVMDPSFSPNPEIPPGRTGLILVDGVYDSVADVPASFTHRLSASFAPLTPEYEGRIAALWPPGQPVSLIGGQVNTSTQSPVVIGPPLAGTGWLATQACCLSPSHRLVLPYSGRLNGGERFAVDWVRVDLTAGPFGKYLRAGGPSTSVEDVLAARNEDYLAYGEELLAVADGTVVAVVSDIPDNATPGVMATGIPVAELGGNFVVIDIGNGVYARYNHLGRGTATVQIGDEVTRGQVIGRLGNAGGSSGPHLHFQLQRAVVGLSGDNVPFEIDDLTFVGSVDADEVFTPGPNAGPRTNQLPLSRSVVDFPPAP